MQWKNLILNETRKSLQMSLYHLKVTSYSTYKKFRELLKIFSYKQLGYSAMCILTVIFDYKVMQLKKILILSYVCFSIANKTKFRFLILEL